MGDVIPLFKDQPPLRDNPPEAKCGNCGNFALSNNGVGFCLSWMESADFGGTCEEFAWPE